MMSLGPDGGPVGDVIKLISEEISCQPNGLLFRRIWLPTFSLIGLELERHDWWTTQGFSGTNVPDPLPLEPRPVCYAFWDGYFLLASF